MKMHRKAYILLLGQIMIRVGTSQHIAAFGTLDNIKIGLGQIKLDTKLFRQRPTEARIVTAIWPSSSKMSAQEDNTLQTTPATGNRWVKQLLYNIQQQQYINKFNSLSLMISFIMLSWVSYTTMSKLRQLFKIQALG
jgi:TRAP-type mannitol/chloroaromatic compound transport system permease large subunit